MKKLAIVIGHTDKSKGASMGHPFHFVQEYEYNTVLAALIRMQMLLTDTQTVIEVFLRDSRGIKKTYASIDKWGADAAIELHFNAFHDTTVTGSEVLFGEIENSIELAKCVHLEINSLMGNNDRGIKLVKEHMRGGTSVNAGKCPKIIVEPFFGSNAKDSARGLKKINELAEAIVAGATTFLSYS